MAENIIEVKNLESSIGAICSGWFVSGLLVASLIQPALWMALYGAAMSNNFSRLSSGMVVPHDAIVVSYLTSWAHE